MSLAPRAVDVKEWTAIAAVLLPELPPYPDNLPVTASSMYGDESWEYLRSDFPPGSGLNRFLDFFGSMRLKKSQLRPQLTGEDDVLVKELKDCMVAAIFRQSSLKYKRKTIVHKPGSIINFFSYAKRIFICIKLAGCSSISELTHSFPEDSFSNIASSDAEYNRLTDVFGIILAFIDAKLITSSLDTKQFSLVRRSIIKDSSRAVGAQTLHDSEIAVALAASRFYIDNFEQIMEVVDAHTRNGGTEKKLALALSKMLPIKRKLYPARVRMQLWTIIKIAGYNFCGWHLGARISEILSARRGFVASEGDRALLVIDRVDLALETRKAIAAVHGEVRVFSVHPYLARVCRVLGKVAELQGCKTDYLFEAPITGEIIEINGFNSVLKRFADDHGYSSNISSHTWRNTLVSVTVRSVAEPLGPLAHLLGHKHLSTVVGYAFSNPFVRKEMRQTLARVMSPRVDRFMDGSRHFGGDGLRGPQGKAIEATLDRHLSRGEDMGASRRAISDQLLCGDFSLSHVDTGVDCIKAPLARGLCTHGNGDILADSDQCQVRCPFRAESSPAREQLRDDIGMVRVRFEEPATTTLMKVRMASEIIQRVASWPELVPILTATLDNSPRLWRFFEELKDD